MKLQHVLESQQFTVPLLMDLFERTRMMEKIVGRGGTRDYENKIMTTLFYKPSTRTRLSFESAMCRLGGKVLATEQAQEFSSEIEGEQLEDTIRIIANYCDVIVLRHHEDGGAKRAAKCRQCRLLMPATGPAGSTPHKRCLIFIPSTTSAKSSTGFRWRLSVHWIRGGRHVRLLTCLGNSIAPSFISLPLPRCRSSRIFWNTLMSTTWLTSYPTAPTKLSRKWMSFTRHASTKRA